MTAVSIPLEKRAANKKLKTAKLIERAALDLLTFGWCTGDLFQQGGKACAVGNLLRAAGVKVEFRGTFKDGDATETDYTRAWYSGGGIDGETNLEPYDLPKIQNALYELAQDIMETEAWKRSGFVTKTPDSVVWTFNDRLGQYDSEVAKQFLVTANRLRNEAAV